MKSDVSWCRRSRFNMADLANALVPARWSVGQRRFPKLYHFLANSPAIVNFEGFRESVGGPVATAAKAKRAWR